MKNKMFRIIDKNNKTIFDMGYKFEIPLYQRKYAWTEKHIDKLIEDVYDKDNDVCYYLGIIVVSIKDNNVLEIIDGQQRLTSLFLLLNALGYNTDKSLCFNYRDKTTYTLFNLNKDDIDEDMIDEDVYKIYNYIKKKIIVKDFDKDYFIKRLKETNIFILDVPKNTNFNHYFEVMNNRGEQLEGYDVVKSKLINFLGDSNSQDKAIFSTIWNACSDMDCYIQERFDIKIARGIFSGNYNERPSLSWSEYKKINDLKINNNKEIDINKIILSNEIYEEEDNKKKDSRFESIIDFPFFLIYTLKVFIERNNIISVKNNKKIDIVIDDKKLIDDFEYVINNGIFNGKRIKEDNKIKAKFSKEFLICLINCRFLFDKYIIKREYKSNYSSEDEVYVLKELRRENKKNNYYNTVIKRCKNDDCMMLLCVLRFSSPSPKSMNWLYEILLWLYEDNKEKYCDILENYIKESVKNTGFLDSDYALGFDTPHIVFNYLEYLLWKREYHEVKEIKYRFGFRNSIEHFYPQNPNNNELESWNNKKELNDFGNLCLISVRQNSRLSNDSPLIKIKRFDKQIYKFSLKMVDMKKILDSYNENEADIKWKNEGYKIHRDKMIKILKEAFDEV